MEVGVKMQACAFVRVYLMSDLDDRARWLRDRKRQRVYNGSFPASADLSSNSSASNRFHPRHSQTVSQTCLEEKVKGKIIYKTAMKTREETRVCVS